MTTKKERNPLAWGIGSLFLIIAILGSVSGMRYSPPESPSENPQGVRGGMTIERHVFPEMVCITVAWKEKMGGVQQVRLDCVRK